MQYSVLKVNALKAALLGMLPRSNRCPPFIHLCAVNEDVACALDALLTIVKILDKQICFLKKPTVTEKREMIFSIWELENYRSDWRLL